MRAIHIKNRENNVEISTVTYNDTAVSKNLWIANISIRTGDGVQMVGRSVRTDYDLPLPWPETGARCVAGAIITYVP
jgi:hypothetical protein